MDKITRYYAAYWTGRMWVETLETRRATRLVASEATGFAYKTFREMDEAIAAKNLTWAA